MSVSTKETFRRYKKYSIDLRRYYRIPAVATSLTVVLSVFITAFFVLVALRPTFITIAELNKKIESSQKTLDQLSTKVAALNSISKTWTQISPLAKFIDSSIPPDGPNYQSITKAIEVLAIENEVEILSENLGESLTYSTIANPYTGRNQTVVAMPFLVRVSGGYSNVSQFLDAILKLDRIVSLESVSLGRDVKLSESGVGIVLNLTGSIHYLADEKQLNKVDPKRKSTPVVKESNEGV